MNNVETLDLKWVGDWTSSPFTHLLRVWGSGWKSEGLILPVYLFWGLTVGSSFCPHLQPRIQSSFLADPSVWSLGIAWGNLQCGVFSSRPLRLRLGLGLMDCLPSHPKPQPRPLPEPFPQLQGASGHGGHVSLSLSSSSESTSYRRGRSLEECPSARQPVRKEREGRTCDLQDGDRVPGLPMMKCQRIHLPMQEM